MLNTKNRNAGLDTIRSAAIIFVLILHSSLLLSPHFNILPYMKLPDGVDIFFVLSGFLIGRMIINKLNAEEKWTLRSAIDFIQRRWFRTLPNYFLFLIINIVLVYVGITQGIINKNTAAYFVFLQNFHKPLDLFFWESWSLSVEEWFYLLFPFLLLILFFTSSNKKSVLATTIALFIIIPFIIRILFAMESSQLSDWTTWDLSFRKLVITRLDCIAVGVLGAFIYVYKNELWKKTKVISFITGIILLTWMCTIKFSQITFFNKTFYFSINAFAIILVFPLLECYKEEKIPFRPLKFISNISYSVYLSHLPLMYTFLKFWPVHNDVQALLRYSNYLIVVGLISNFLFRFFEEPIKNIRETFSKKITQKKLSL